MSLVTKRGSKETASKNIAKRKRVSEGQGELFDQVDVKKLPDTDVRYLPLDDAEDDDVLYLADFSNCALKDVVGSLEFPNYLLSNSEDIKETTFEYNDIVIEISSGKYGLPTMFDKGVMIYIVSQFMRLKKEGAPPGRYLRLQVNDVLKFCKRSQCGRGYKSLMQSLDRLSGTLIKTNVPPGKGAKRVKQRRHKLLDRADSVHHLEDEDRRLDYIEVKISDWIYDAIKENNVLTLSPGYWDLTANEQRVYELARKHAGTKKSCTLKVSTIFRKSGTLLNGPRYKYRLKKMAATNKLPDYEMEFETRPDPKSGKMTDYIVFKNRNTVPGAAAEAALDIPQFHPSFIEELQEIFKGITTDKIYEFATDFARTMARSKKQIRNFESEFMIYLMKEGSKGKKKRSPATA